MLHYSDLKDIQDHIYMRCLLVIRMWRLALPAPPLWWGPYAGHMALRLSNQAYRDISIR